MEEYPRPLFVLRLGHLVVVDVVLAALVGVNGWANPEQLGRHALPVWLFTVMTSAVVVAVAVRRLWPVSALALSVGGYLGLATSGFTKSAVLGIVLVLYVVGLSARPRAAVVGLIASVVAVVGGMVLGDVVATGGWPAEEDPVLAVAGRIGPMVAFWTVGLAVRRHRAYQDGLREQAEQRAEARIDHSRRMVVEERLRIARELHDVVAHSMSVVAVQAGVGSHVIATQPEEAARSLAAIETTTRAALREMRALLGVLREEPPDDGGLLPTPGLVDLADLVTRTGRTGVRVELVVCGTRREVPQGVDLAAYRIVQEALTNVVKHARARHGEVLVRYAPGEVEVRVTDDGAGPPDAPGETGHGLVGMRERTALYGGEFTAGPGPDGGFRVTARLPA